MLLLLFFPPLCYFDEPDFEDDDFRTTRVTGFISCILWWFGASQKNMQAVLLIKKVKYWYLPLMRLLSMGEMLLCIPICSNVILPENWF